MSCFKLPVGLCHDIEMLIQKFWWGECGDQRKIHWKNWETLCKPSQKGDWASRTWQYSTRLCWLNKCGGCTLIEPHYFTGCLVQSSFVQDQFLMQRTQKANMHGKEYLRQGLLSRKGCYRELEMVIKFNCSMITGFQGIFQQKRCLVT